MIEACFHVSDLTSFNHFFEGVDLLLLFNLWAWVMIYSIVTRFTEFGFGLLVECSYTHRC